MPWKASRLICSIRSSVLEKLRSPGSDYRPSNKSASERLGTLKLPSRIHDVVEVRLFRGRKACGTDLLRHGRNFLQVKTNPEHRQRRNATPSIELPARANEFYFWN